MDRGKTSSLSFRMKVLSTSWGMAIQWPYPLQRLLQAKSNCNIFRALKSSAYLNAEHNGRYLPFIHISWEPGWQRGLSSIPVGARCFPSPRRTYQFWGPLRDVASGYRERCLRSQTGRGVKLTIYLQVVPRSRIHGSIFPLLPLTFAS
jgi:hypothetical protein